MVEVDKKKADWRLNSSNKVPSRDLKAMEAFDLTHCLPIVNVFYRTVATRATADVFRVQVDLYKRFRRTSSHLLQVGSHYHADFQSY